MNMKGPALGNGAELDWAFLGATHNTITHAFLVIA